MRRISSLIGGGLALIATPTLAHVGDHGDHSIIHFLADHGIAAALVTLAVLGTAVYFIRRKG